MAGPSNIRINPFTGTGGATNYIELTEKHIIPAVSPYVIRLNEVPEKQDPSNMKMVYVNESTGAATSTTLTEVAATPGKGEFRPDYSTNALDDKTWNTGLIEFSASDAGKIVQVTYTGTGTLAGVNSNHWPSWYTDRGDGSDGDFVPTENTTISGVKNYKSVFIKSGLTITVDKYVLIKCQGAFINKGTITANGKGCAGGSGGTGSSDISSSELRTQGKGSNGSTGVITSGGTGGAGGAGNDGGGNRAVAGGAGGTPKYFGFSANSTMIESIVKANIPIAYGGTGGGGGGAGGGGLAGGKGGYGGGCIFIIAAGFINSGSITSNGATGSAGAKSSTGRVGAGGGGGGAGGTIAIIASNVGTQGTITVSGGSGGAGGNSGDTTWGGANGAAGGAGTKYIKSLGA